MINKPPMKDPGLSHYMVNYFFQMFTLSRDVGFLPTVSGSSTSADHQLYQVDV
jgi:hypothetical protein